MPLLDKERECNTLASKDGRREYTCNAPKQETKLEGVLCMYISFVEGRGGGRNRQTDPCPTTSQQVPLTSHLLLQAQDDRDGLVQYQELGLWLLTVKMQLAHPPQLFKCFVDISDSKSFPGIVCHSPLFLTLSFLFWRKVIIILIIFILTVEGRWSSEDKYIY